MFGTSLGSSISVSNNSSGFVGDDEPKSTFLNYRIISLILSGVTSSLSTRSLYLGDGFDSIKAMFIDSSTTR